MRWSATPPGVLRHIKTPDGRPLVQGKKVTGFTNLEEKAVGLTKWCPFLVEDELQFWRASLEGCIKQS